MERIDCHCHIFNIVNVGWRVLLEQLSEVVSPRNRDISERGLMDKVGKIAGLIKAFTRDSAHIFKMLDKEYDQQYKLFALMFDGDFLLDASVNRQIRKMQMQIRDTLQMSVKQQDRGINLSGSPEQFPAENEDILLVLDFLNDLYPEKVDREVRGLHKDGFSIQYEQIKKMSERSDFKDRLVPFLGVDPRRPDILTYLDQVGKDKLFAGIKVYPPNGFSPMDKVLAGSGSVFEFCSMNGIPVISHCSFGGFATPVKTIDVNGMIIPKGQHEPVKFDGKYNFRKGLRDGFSKMVQERAAVLNHPKIWAEVLKKYENLTLVLAHFGVGSEEWQDEILRMLYQYKNLFTDVSCVSDTAELKRIKKIYQDNPGVRHKILYGSDFFLDLLFNDSFSQYKERMEKVLGKTIFDKLSVDNPAGFVDIWYKP